MNNDKFNDYIDGTYPEELEIKDTTDAPKWANYLDLRPEFGEYGKLYKRLYDKRDDSYFPIVLFSYLSRNIPESSAYGNAMVVIYYARVIEAGMIRILYGFPYEMDFSHHESPNPTRVACKW